MAESYLHNPELRRFLLLQGFVVLFITASAVGIAFCRIRVLHRETVRRAVGIINELSAAHPELTGEIASALLKSWNVG